jgi:hypothetical protein
MIAAVPANGSPLVNGDYFKGDDDLLKRSRQSIYAQQIARKVLEHHPKFIFITAD